MKPINTIGRLWSGVRGKFAPQPRWRAFVPWQTYYRAYLGADAAHPLAQHTGPYVGDGSRRTGVIDAMAAGRGPTIVRAPPGCGKSRFALELARRIEKGRNRWEVVFVNHDEALVREELPELIRLNGVVFIVDDAHECPQLVEVLATACLQSASAHLICLSRPAGRFRVTRALNTVLAPGAVHEIDLGRPPGKQVRSLIDQLLPKASPHHRDTIERFVRQSYFGAVLVCGILSRQEKLPQTFQRQDLRDRVCREPLREAAQGVCAVDAAVRALAVYAALAPVHKDSPDARALAAEAGGLAPAAVDNLLGRVVGAGLFQESAQSLLRPLPDLLGDLLLEEACLDVQGKGTEFGVRLLERLAEQDPQRVAHNCAEVGQLFGSAQDVDLISAFVLERARAMSPGSRSDLARLVRLCRPFAASHPATILELVKVLQGRGLLRRTPADFESDGEVPEWDVCVMLLEASDVDPSAVPAALQLARDAYVAMRKDPDSEQRVLGLLGACCRFEVGRSVKHSKAVADTLHAWMLERDAESAALAAFLSAHLLVLEVRGRELADGAASPGTLLTSGAEIQTVRDVATDTLVRGLSHGNATVQRTAIAALEQYASGWPSLDRARLESWRPQLTREVTALAGGIVAAAKASASLPVWSAAEHQGWLWWTHEADFLHRAGVSILEAIPSTDAYRLWKVLYAPRLPVTTAIPAAVSDATGRLQHVAGFASADETSVAMAARQLFDALDEHCLDADSWRNLWRSALEQVPHASLREHAGAIFAEFARRHPDVAWSFVNVTDADGPFFPMLPHLLIELGKNDPARRSEEARHVLRGTSLEYAWLRALSMADDLEEPERALLARGLESSDARTVLDTAESLLSDRSSDRVPGFLIVFGAIARHPSDVGLWEVVIEKFVTWAELVLPPRIAEPAPAMTRVAHELIALFRTFAPSLRWGFQRHTRQLGRALAILAVISPTRLQEWMQRAWSQPRRSGGSWNDESPLSVSRLSEIMRAVRNTSSAQHWFGVFVEWMPRDSYLGTVGALGLGELCALDDARIGDLVAAIDAQPTEAAVRSLAEFIQCHKFDRAFARKLIALLDIWTRFPQSYPRVEAVIVGMLVNGASGRPDPSSPVHERALIAIEARRSEGELPRSLAASLERAEREVRAAMESASA